VVKRMVQVVVVLLIQAAVLFVAEGRVDWMWAWAFLGLYLAVLVVNGLVLVPRSPDMIAERAEVKKDAKAWDKWLATIVSLVGPLLTLVAAGLDFRLGWSSPFAVPVHIVALVVVALGYAIVSWSMASNRFFSGVVRIQKDRGHSVASGGPYAIVRHPGYVGIGLFTIAAPIVLGSTWALVPAALTVAVLVVRTALEDRTLQNELDGYRGYAQRVRYRLVPGIW
jgi:protein-S-isoprenylcysteine O-methyltransferase Ste14